MSDLGRADKWSRALRDIARNKARAISDSRRIKLRLNEYFVAGDKRLITHSKSQVFMLDSNFYRGLRCFF